MTRFTLSLVALAFAMALFPASALAQQTDTPQFFCPYDQRGLQVFETPKDDARPYEGFELYWGAAFTQQFQALDHSNEAEPMLNADDFPGRSIFHEGEFNGFMVEGVVAF